MSKRWSKERIWEWYNSRPWIRGCNYMSADCANRVDQWQELGFEDRFQTTEEELKLMQETGYNCVRIIIEHVVWRDDHDGFMQRFDRYLSLCQKYGVSCMVVLANDCMPPKTELWSEPYIGVQKYDLGYHGGKKHSQHGSHNGPAPHFYLDDPDKAALYYEMVREIVEKYKNDERIIIWDVFNEPGNSRRHNLSLPHLRKLFEIIREIDPIQPLTCAIWRNLDKDTLEPTEIEQFGLDNSDIISYHNYGSYCQNIHIIKMLKELGRPIINSEWLGRVLNNNVYEMFPLFYLEKIGCFNWGFVAGKYQTYEPWEGTWNRYYNDHDTSLDFTKWFHDLYRPNHRPYDPKEIELIKEFCTKADKDFERKRNNG